jgi:hypothetical protein
MGRATVRVTKTTLGMDMSQGSVSRHFLREAITA